MFRWITVVNRVGRVGTSLCRLRGLLVVLFLSGCGRDIPERTHFRGTHDLSGTWRLELRERQGLTTRAINGDLVMRRNNIPAGKCKFTDRVTCKTFVEGMHTLDTNALIGHRIPDAAQGEISADGEVSIVLGECCERGNIDLAGRGDANVVRGRWVTVRSGDLHRGRFVLQRMP